MANQEPSTSPAASQKRFSEFWRKYKKPIQIVSAIFSFVFIAIPGWVNSVTGAPFAEWLKQQGITMSFLRLISWGLGLAIFIVLFIVDRGLAKESKTKFSWVPWVYVVGFMIFILFNGLQGQLTKIVTPNVTNTVYLASESTDTTGLTDTGKKLLARESSPWALGRLYAKSSRWNEAAGNSESAYVFMYQLSCIAPANWTETATLVGEIASTYENLGRTNEAVQLYHV